MPAPIDDTDREPREHPVRDRRTRARLDRRAQSLVIVIAVVVGLIAAVDIPIVHFSVLWWRGLHQGPTIGDPSKILNPSAPLLFVAALLAMVGAFTLIWVYLMIRRYQLARLEWRNEDDARLGRVNAARRSASASVTSVGSTVDEPAG